MTSADAQEAVGTPDATTTAKLRSDVTTLSQSVSALADNQAELVKGQVESDKQLIDIIDKLNVRVLDLEKRVHEMEAQRGLRP